jgi:hypothetical protein
MLPPVSNVSPVNLGARGKLEKVSSFGIVRKDQPKAHDQEEEKG